MCRWGNCSVHDTQSEEHIQYGYSKTNTLHYGLAFAEQFAEKKITMGSQPWSVVRDVRSATVIVQGFPFMPASSLGIRERILEYLVTICLRRPMKDGFSVQFSVEKWHVSPLETWAVDIVRPQMLTWRIVRVATQGWGHPSGGGRGVRNSAWCTGSQGVGIVQIQIPELEVHLPDIGWGRTDEIWDGGIHEDCRRRGCDFRGAFVSHATRGSRLDREDSVEARPHPDASHDHNHTSRWPKTAWITTGIRSDNTVF